MANENKRYNLNLPTELYERISQIADDKDVSIAHLMRVFLRLGLETLEDGAHVFVVDTDENREREIKLLL